jgi:hypothetical protein
VVIAALADEVVHDPARVRERAVDLLSRPPYREEPEGLLARLVGDVREWLADTLDTILGAVAADATRAWVVIAVGVAILLLVVWRSTRGLSVDRAVDPPVTGEGDGRPAAAWHAEADAHERAGDHAQAVRCRYVALVTTLVEQGVVEEVPGRTVGELDRELATSAPTLAPDVTAAGDIFVEVVYGRASGTPEQTARLRELARAVTAAAGGRRRVVAAGSGA